jgi:hypothetical protein
VYSIEHFQLILILLLFFFVLPFTPAFISIFTFAFTSRIYCNIVLAILFFITSSINTLHYNHHLTHSLPVRTPLSQFSPFSPDIYSPISTVYSPWSVKGTYARCSMVRILDLRPSLVLGTYTPYCPVLKCRISDRSAGLECPSVRLYRIQPAHTHNTLALSMSNNCLHGAFIHFSTH